MSKPDYLGEQFSARFQDQSVVDRYHLRPTYPPETFRILASLIVDEPRYILDAGCGSGDIARHMLDYAERIDAVDVSPPMLEKGKTLPGGDSPKIRWLHGKTEDIALSPPYALITAGQSLHWMEWDIVLPRFQQVLTPSGMLAILTYEMEMMPWSEGLGKIIRRYSTNRMYQPYDMIGELEKLGLFQKAGEARTAAVPFRQSLQNTIESFHAMSSLSRNHMTSETAAMFDEEVGALLSAYTRQGILTAPVIGHTVWGRPLS